ncbi:MAG: Plug domain-containing protein, partial [Oscillospiraceae bacterium]|nr:Plug domain-containing protein [Oscillospiraceae bacterium]
LLSNVPGLDYIQGEFGIPTFYFPRVSGSFSLDPKPAKIYVDNILMNPDGDSSESSFDVRTIPMTAIFSVEAVSHPTSALMGMDGSVGGAILIMTKKWEEYFMDNRTNPGIKTYMPLGYKNDVEFYAPKYETPEARYAAKSDLRTTLYWNPNNVLVKGKSNFDFYTADSKSSYSIVVEGITSEGKIFRQIRTIDNL